MPHEVIMPALGMAQDTGKLVSWIKKEGDAVKTGDVLFEVETDKSTMEVDAQADGYLSGVSANAGDDVPVGKVIAQISDEPGAAAPAPEETEEPATEPVAGTAPETNPEPEPEKAVIPDAPAMPAAPETSRILASPKARRIASEMGFDLADLVQAGHPQPYHVADIEVLKTLPPEPQTQLAPTGGEAFIAPRFIALEAKTKGVRDFLKWMQTDGNITLETANVWISYAAACLRKAKQEEDRVLTLGFSFMNDAPELYIDADKQRLSKLVASEDQTMPDLLIKDITSSQISHMRLSAGDAPVLTIAKVKKRYLLSLEFTAQQLTDDQAIAFMLNFCERLNDPLKHVL